MKFIVTHLLIMAGMLSQQFHALALSVEMSVTRRAFVSKAIVGAATIATATEILAMPHRVLAATPEITTLESGIKYATLKKPGKDFAPQKGDIVAIEYTGYLADGTIWDSTHAEGKNNNLLFKLGTDVVIDGINEMVSNMAVGQKVQAIIPPKLAFGDKGLCLENGECLIKPGSTLVYDIYLKKASIPPP
jgi:FKBP-type peptidyl-prolyl cis-trans isomerase